MTVCFKQWKTSKKYHKKTTRATNISMCASNTTPRNKRWTICVCYTVRRVTIKRFVFKKTQGKCIFSPVCCRRIAIWMFSSWSPVLEILSIGQEVIVPSAAWKWGPIVKHLCCSYRGRLSKQRASRLWTRFFHSQAYFISLNRRFDVMKLLNLHQRQFISPKSLDNSNALISIPNHKDVINMVDIH